MAKLGESRTQLWAKLRDRFVDDRPDGLSASGKMYHVTTRDNLAAIARDGLKFGNNPSGVFNSDYEALRRLHGLSETPPFVARGNNGMLDRLKDYHVSVGKRSVMLEVDVRGLSTGADTCALADLGAGFTRDEGGAWVVFVNGKNFKHLNETPFEREFRSELDRDGEMPLRRFERPELAAKAIRLTGSMVVLESIAPERIRVVRERGVAPSWNEPVQYADSDLGAVVYRQGSDLPPLPQDQSSDRAERGHRALADRFRHSSQAERVKDPQLNAASKVLAHTNGVIDAAYGHDTAKGAAARSAALGKIAGAIERGDKFSVPKTLQPVREQVREPERSRGKSIEPER